jgi:hypothetical protein
MMMSLLSGLRLAIWNSLLRMIRYHLRRTHAENDPAFCDLHRSINALKRILSGSQGKYPV